MLAVDPSLFAEVHGSTDTEVVFYLALTLGLEDDPIAALERTVGVIESAAEARGVEGAVQATFGVSDGESLWAVRYATTAPRDRSSRRPTWRPCAGCTPTTRGLRAWGRRSPDRLGAVLRPPGRLAQIPEATAVTVRRGGVLERPFQPRP